MEHEHGKKRASRHPARLAAAIVKTLQAALCLQLAAGLQRPAAAQYYSNSSAPGNGPYLFRPSLQQLGPNSLAGYGLASASLAEERAALMYPYSLNDRTDISSGKPYHDQSLQFRLPFFGFSYEYIWIQRNGYVSFNRGMQTYEFPLHLPIQPVDALDEEDPSLMAPFFAMQDVARKVQGAGIYLRIVNLADTQAFLDDEFANFRDRVTLDFREGMVGAQDFTPKWALLVTWRNMTVANRRPEKPLQTNTYQLVLATDEIRTYAMFNYEQIKWVTHLDNFDGLKGAAAFVGFNAGNTTRTFEFRPYSQHQRVSMLPAGGFGNNLRGRYYFQVDEEVWPGACIDKKLDPNLRDRLPLTFFPRYGHMLGGTLVDVTGPCLEPSSIIFCRFDNFKAEAVFRDTNRATCISPPFMYHGYVDLTISVDERIEFVGRFYIQPPEIAEEEVIVLDGQDREEAPAVLELKWRPQRLSWHNDTSVTISLWGYRESMNVYPALSYISTLGQARLGQAHHALALSQFWDRDEAHSLDLLFGFIAVNLTNPQVLGRGMRQSPIIWSRPMPLSWYFRAQWLRAIGPNYKDHFCDAWFERESFSDRFAATVWRCPCTYDQVKVDRGRFSPDLQCNIIDRRCDTFHKEALHCFNTGRPSIGGSGQTCCYDDQGELIQTADTVYGGRPTRAFVYGKHPFKIRMMIPSLSSWVHDVAPFFYCCLWQPQRDNSPACQNYNQYRTSQDCSLYQAPVVGSVYGDPHLITFNKNNYTFNGKGEYVLVRADDPKVKFDVQARFEQVPQRLRNLPPVPASQLTAVAVQDNFSSIVEFRVRPLAARWRYHIYVLVDDQYIFWWDRSLQVQNFRGVTLYQPAGIQNMSHIIAMFDSGAGVEVMSIDGYMTAHVYLPADFQGITGGLLGNYSRRGQRRPEDLVAPGGQRFSARSPLELLHRNFGQEWRVTEVERLGVGRSLFSHSAVSYSMYDQPRFEPSFQLPPMLAPELQHLQPELDSVCSDSLSCIYDYVVSYGNKELAETTKRFEAIAFEIANSASQHVVRCPALPKPAHGMKSENRYWPGKVVRFSCDVGYRLVGYEARYCREDGLWSWGEEPECISEWRYYLIMLASVAAAFVPMAVTIGAGILCLAFMVRRSRAHYTGERGEERRPFAEKAPSSGSLNRTGAGSGYGEPRPAGGRRGSSLRDDFDDELSLSAAATANDHDHDHDDDDNDDDTDDQVAAGDSDDGLRDHAHDNRRQEGRARESQRFQLGSLGPRDDPRRRARRLDGELERGPLARPEDDRQDSDDSADGQPGSGGQRASLYGRSPEAASRPPPVATSSRSIFDVTPTRSLYMPSRPTMQDYGQRFGGPISAAAAAAAAATQQVSSRQHSSTTSQPFGLPLRPKPGRGSASSTLRSRGEPDYGPVREARI